jgi:hypothetical protein
MGLLNNIKKLVGRDTKQKVTPNVDGCHNKTTGETTDEIIADIEDVLNNIDDVSIRDNYEDDCGDCEDCDFNDDDEMSDEERDIAENFLGQISFTVLKDGRLFVNCGWANSNDDTAEIYGKFLFLLNDGRMTKNILQYLLEFGSQDYRLAKFSNKIMEAWSKMDDEENNKPIISPLKVFAIHNAETEED